MRTAGVGSPVRRAASATQRRSAVAAARRRDVLNLSAAAAATLLLPLNVGEMLVGAPPAASEALAAPTADAGAKASVQKAYDGYAPSYDELDGGSAAEALGFSQLRAELLSKARGDVLEVAVGTGLNLRFYDFGALSSLTAVDISEGMLAQARRRAARELPPDAERRVSLRQADATALPLGAAAFDTVVDTFSLCVIPDPAAALSEMARVVRPGGQVLLLEHAKSDNPLLAAYQDVSAEAVASTAKGCYWNQDLPALLKGAGLRATRFSRYTAGTIVLIEAERV